MATVALEINRNHILLAAWKGAGSKVTHALEIPIENGASNTEISALLKKTIDQNGLSRSDAIVVLSRSESELRELELPPAPDAELPDMVRFKAKSDFASFNDRWLLDYVALSSDPSVPRKVLAAAIAPAVSERIEAIVEPTGLKLKQMVLRPLAIINLFINAENDNAVRLIVNPGDRFTDIIVTKNNQPISTRSIRVSDQLSVDKRNELLVSEVRRTLASTKRQLNGQSITQVVLLDDEKSNKHLIGNLTQRLKIDIDLVDPFTLLGSEKSKSVTKSSASEQPWQYAALLGSLQGQSKVVGTDIDFLNPSKRIEKSSDQSRTYLYGGLAGLAAILTIGFGWWTLSSQTSEIDFLTKRYRDATQVNEADGARPGIDTMLAKTGKIDDWNRRNIHWLDELDAMSSRFLTADEAIVDSIDLYNRTAVPAMSLRSQVASNAEEANLTSSLETRPYIVTPDRTEVSGDKDYPLLFVGTVSLEQKGNQWLKAITDHARKFAAKQNEFESSSPSEETN